MPAGMLSPLLVGSLRVLWSVAPSADGSLCEDPLLFVLARPQFKKARAQP